MLAPINKLYNTCSSARSKEIKRIGICCEQVTGFRIVFAWKFFKINISNPIKVARRRNDVIVIVVCFSYWDFPADLVAYISVYICVHKI